MTELIAIVLGSEAVTVIITAIITAISNRKSKLKTIETELANIDKKLGKSEKDALRTQLLLMISDYPEEKAEIMTLAQHYFGGLHGNWYLSTLFDQWMKKHGITAPSWFQIGGDIND